MKLSINSKKKLGIIIALSCIAFCALLFCLIGYFTSDPKKAFTKAYKKTFVDTPSEALLGNRQIISTLKENPAYSSGLSLTLQEISGVDLGEYTGLFSGVGFSLDTASDLRNRKGSGTLDITYVGNTCLSFGGHLQGSKFHLTCPQLLDGNLFVNFGTLKEDLLTDSVTTRLMQDVGFVLTEDSITEFFNILGSPSSLLTFTDFNTTPGTPDNPIIVEELKKKDVSLPDTVSAKKVYRITVPEEVYSSLLTSSNADIQKEIEKICKELGDIVVIAAVSKDGYIRYMETSSAYEETELTLTAVFSGKKNISEEAEFEFCINPGEDTVILTLCSSFDAETRLTSFSSDITANDETVLSFAYEGEFDDIEKGVAYTLDFDYLEIYLKDIVSVSLTGDCYIDTETCEITPPSGTEYNLITIDDSELFLLITEIIQNLQTDPLLSGLLDTLDIGM